MDVEKLIVLVQSRQPLWNQKLPQYHMRNVQMKLWEEIEVEMKMPVNNMKKKWKGLRDTYRKELKKCLEEKSGSGADLSKQWPYFTQMEFLSDTMFPNNTQTSIPDSQEEYDNISQSESSPHEPEENDEQQLPQQNETIEASTPSKKKEFKSPLKRNRKKQKRDEIDEQFLEIEKQKFSLFSKAANEESDDDHQFLMSLQPFLRKVPAEQKLQARMEMMNVLMKYTSPNNNPLSSQHYPSQCTSPASSLSDSSSNIQNFYSSFDPTTQQSTYHSFQ